MQQSINHSELSKNGALSNGDYSLVNDPVIHDLINTSMDGLHQGDCIELMKDIPDQSIDLILCDLPYGITQNKWDSLIPLDQLWDAYRRIIKPRGVIALTSQGVFTAKLILSNEKWFRYKFVWIKSKPTNFLNARRQPLRQHEDICIFPIIFTTIEF